MKNQKPLISQLHGEAFLVCDKMLMDHNSAIFEWLRNEGFTYGWSKGNYGVCDWAFINITSKQYACGMPGVQITVPTGNHAITLNEFMTIYNIYKKYESKELFACRDTSEEYIECPD